MQMKYLRAQVSELVGAKDNFEGLFHQAVFAALPAHVQDIIERALDRELEDEEVSDSPILLAIYADAVEACRVTLAGDHDGDAYSYTEAAVARSVERVIGMLEGDNVVRFTRVL